MPRLDLELVDVCAAVPVPDWSSDDDFTAHLRGAQTTKAACRETLGAGANSVSAFSMSDVP